MNMKRKLFAVVMVVAVTFLLIAAKKTPSAAQAAPDFAAMEREWLRAQDEGDVPALSKIYDDDFVGTTFTGKVLSRSDILPEDEGQRTPKMYSVLESVQGRIVNDPKGDTAVVIGQAATGEGDNAMRFRFTKVYVQKAGEWKLVAAHLSRIQK